MFKDERTSDFPAICRAIGYQFRSKRLLIQALTRQSAIQEGVQVAWVDDNQSLEFIGDKVIGFAISN
jgi:dsRNA-specific ribonuclease